MFGIDLIDASLLPAMGIALIAGFMSFISPCVLPIVPPYLAYMGGISVTELQGGGDGRRRSVVPAAAGFVLGLSTVFLLLGFAASAFGSFFLSNSTLFAQVAGVVVMVFGAHFVGIYRIPFLDREMRVDAGDRGGSIFGAYVLGLAFAFGWTPCIGPVLGPILTLAGGRETVSEGALLLAAYSLGLGIPFLAAALFSGAFMRFLGKFRVHLGRVEKAIGALLVVAGLFFLTGGVQTVSYWLLENFPLLGQLG